MCVILTFLNSYRKICSNAKNKSHNLEIYGILRKHPQVKIFIE